AMTTFRSWGLAAMDMIQPPPPGPTLTAGTPAANALQLSKEIRIPPLAIAHTLHQEKRELHSKTGTAWRFYQTSTRGVEFLNSPHTRVTAEWDKCQIGSVRLVSNARRCEFFRILARNSGRYFPPNRMVTPAIAVSG